MSNEKYLTSKLALIQKIPTPIKPITIDQATRHITLAYFDQKSTVDYIGVVQGIPVCFDAKETAVDTFPLQNIHEHQIQFMTDFERQNGISFIIMYFSNHDEFYYIPFSDIIKFWERGKNGGRKSFTYDEINKNFQIHSASGVLVHYLETIQKDIEQRCSNGK
jgi:recombination protein U